MGAPGISHILPGKREQCAWWAVWPGGVGGRLTYNGDDDDTRLTTARACKFNFYDRLLLNKR